MNAIRAAGRPVLLTLLGIGISGCGAERSSDAYGNFEAIEVVVSAESPGQIREFVPVEGIVLEAGTAVARIDTIQLALERQQARAQRGAADARRLEAVERLRALEVQYEIAGRSYERSRRLFAAQAATAQQVDQAERDYRTLGAQLRALRAQQVSAEQETAAADARLEQIEDRLARSTVTNPVAGTVLATYARAGEFVNAGHPLYSIASLDTLILRAYVSGAQLAAVRLGQTVEVHVDRDRGGSGLLHGTVSWISPSAEFTPTPIQTRDERADLVYAVKVRVANPEGMLKIGMPADLTLPTARVTEDVS